MYLLKNYYLKTMLPERHTQSLRENKSGRESQLLRLSNDYKFHVHCNEIIRIYSHVYRVFQGIKELLKNMYILLQNCCLKERK